MQRSSRVDYDAIAPLYDSQPHREKLPDPALAAFLAERSALGTALLLDIACGTANGNAELSPWTQPISADLARAWRSMPSDPSNPTILALDAIARLATSWLPVPQAMSKSNPVPSADRSARNAASAGSGDFERPGRLS